MPQRRIPAVFVRGGTSRALVFHARDLPAGRGAWDPIFLRALGSPDPNGRQLDGMGGGVSSLSKVAVIGPPSRPDADVDYTFGQVSVEKALVDYRGNCGNISSAVGPFAVDEGLVAAPRDGEALVRIHNTNTGKIIRSRFWMEGGSAAVEGDCALPGVAGAGARVTLEFEDPGGAATGRLLPTGKAVETLYIPGLGPVEASLVDATNPVVFVRAGDVGLAGSEGPGAMDARTELMVNLEQIRAEAAVRMGLAPDRRTASESVLAVPKVAVVAPPAEYLDLRGERVPEESFDILSRVVSMGKTHRAYALTAAMCLAVAARIPGTLAHEAARAGGGDIRLGHPSGVQPVGAEVENANGSSRAAKVIVYRTARRLMEGAVLIPRGLFPA
ncbi:MAG: PrpF family protein [Candidatus Tectomicrobia bacterium]|uniref:PrpF family protein n=1 Tax=Tectimicrobiota bacterium TaxID=2528274 RepID=A0A932I090_UNCTE|nr:PrpF family protein [Candidatus Tectomicrobia bacterium]